MASGVYNVFKHLLMEKVFDLVNDTLKVALMTNSHTFAPSSVTNDVWGDVSANETSGTAYVAGGAALANKTVTVDDTGNKGVLDADDVTWATSTITAYHAVLYDDTVASPVKPLICSFDLGGAQSSLAGDFKIIWNSAGILNIA